MSKPGNKPVPDAAAPGAPGPRLHLDHDECRAAGAILARIGDKWSVQVVVQLGGGPRRFSDIKRAVGAISQRMLTLTLRGLERDGLVTRTVTPVTPPRVDYALTPLGGSLLGPVEALGLWVRKHSRAIRQAQRVYDARSGDAGA